MPNHVNEAPQILQTNHTRTAMYVAVPPPPPRVVDTRTALDAVMYRTVTLPPRSAYWSDGVIRPIGTLPAGRGMTATTVTIDEELQYDPSPRPPQPAPRLPGGQPPMPTSQLPTVDSVDEAQRVLDQMLTFLTEEARYHGHPGDWRTMVERAAAEVPGLRYKNHPDSALIRVSMTVSVEVPSDSTSSATIGRVLERDIATWADANIPEETTGWKRRVKWMLAHPERINFNERGDVSWPEAIPAASRRNGLEFVRQDEAPATSGE